MPLRGRGIANMTVPPQGPPPGSLYQMPQYGYPQWGPSDRCPFLDSESPKIYGSADKAAVEAKVSEFAGA